MAEKEVAIQVSDLTKMYKLYDKPSDRLKEVLGLSRQKKYKEHLALNHVDMTIYKGETVGIIGTNGSGKSTILKIITGVLTPTSGEVIVKGHISALLELGAGFNLEYNGIDNIFLNGMMIGFSEEEIKKRLNAILDFADIGDYVYQPVKTYSSGMFVLHACQHRQDAGGGACSPSWPGLRPLLRFRRHVRAVGEVYRSPWRQAG